MSIVYQVTVIGAETCVVGSIRAGITQSNFLMTMPAKSSIVRTGRGLTIGGTRTTLYSLMDYVEADWPPDLIRAWLDLSEPQMTAAMDYIESHREEVETEYRTVLRQAEENRRYWQRRQPHPASSVAEPHPRREEIRSKLRTWKEQLDIA